jgi:DNA-binding response OmpR family regulator
MITNVAGQQSLRFETPNPVLAGGKANLPPRILVADDEKAIRSLITDSLTRSGYEVDTADDGAAAWEALQAKRYDLLITDHSMPKVTGVELIKKLRGQGAALPVVMVSGAVPAAELEMHPHLGISAIVLKPFALGALVETVHNILRASASLVVMLLWRLAACAAQEVKPITKSPLYTHGVVAQFQAVATPERPSFKI